MGKPCNLAVHYNPIFGMTLTNVQSNGVYIKSNPDKAKGKTLRLNNSKAFHLRRTKIT